VAEKGTDGICHNADPERLPERGRDEDDGKAIEGDHKVRYDGAGDQEGHVPDDGPYGKEYADDCNISRFHGISFLIQGSTGDRIWVYGGSVWTPA